ncbi:hypothetical protein DFS34DRAFT_606554 [Phlyctochytrium arcticum]|nr:hypothetical protein DFS34DRAFT_606554 [Phlyctochytrium arcticum]
MASVLLAVLVVLRDLLGLGTAGRVGLLTTFNDLSRQMVVVDFGVPDPLLAVVDFWVTDPLPGFCALFGTCGMLMKGLKKNLG